MSLLASLLFPIVNTRARGGYENPSNPLEPGNWWEGGFGGDMSDAGIHVNRQTALTYAAVWRGVQLITGDVGKLPLVVYKAQGGGKEKDRRHPSYPLLRRKPNPEMTAIVFKRTLQGHALLCGNGYAWVERRGDAAPSELIPLLPDKTWPVRENGQLLYGTEYVIDGRTERRKILPENMLHIRGLGYDGLTGYSFIECGRNSLGLGMAAQKYGSKFLSNNARPSVVIEVPGNMGAEAQKMFLSQWDSMHQGVDSAHKTAILQQGAKVNPFSINASDAQLLETRQFEIREIANWLGIPPHKLGDSSRTAYNSLEQENQSYLDEALDPWLVTWEEECFDKLLTEKQKEQESHSIEFMRNALVRANLSERFAAYAVAITNGIMSPNEARAKENMNPYEGGDEYLRPLNMGTPGAVATEDEPEPEPPAEPDEAERFAPLVKDTLHRLVRRIGHYAEREAKQPVKFGDWLESFATINEQTVRDSLYSVSVPFGKSPIDLAAQFFQEMRAAFDAVYSKATPDQFAQAIAECVTQLETELPTRWAAELTKGTEQ